MNGVRKWDQTDEREVIQPIRKQKNQDEYIDLLFEICWKEPGGSFDAIMSFEEMKQPTIQDDSFWNAKTRKNVIE